MSAKSMWGDLNKLDGVKTPVIYLREQAQILSEATNGILEGEVTQIGRGTQFEIELDVIVPTINQYRLTILRVTQPIAIYPLRIQDFANNEIFTCDDEAKFLSTLESILSSPNVRKMLATLISQSQT